MAINTIKQSRPKLAKFLRETCKEDLGEASGDLFGLRTRQKVIERANTIEAFNKALARVESGPSNTRNMVSSPSNCSFLSKRPTGRYGGMQVRPSFHPVQTQTDLQQVQTDLQQVQTPKVIGRSMAPVPRAQKANTHPTQCQDITTTIKQQGRPVGGALRFKCQEWQKLTDNHELLCALSSEATRAEHSPRERDSGSPSKEPTTKSGFFSLMFVVASFPGLPRFLFFGFRSV